MATFQDRTAEAGAAVLQLLQLVGDAAKAEETLQMIAESVLPFGGGFKDDSWVERCGTCAPVSLSV